MSLLSWLITSEPFLYLIPPPLLPLPPTHHTLLWWPQIGEHQQVPAPQASEYKHIPPSRHSQHPHPITHWYHPRSYGHKESKGLERSLCVRACDCVRVFVRRQPYSSWRCSHKCLSVKGVTLSRLWTPAEGVEGGHSGCRGLRLDCKTAKDAMTIPTGHMKMRTNIPARMNALILMCSCFFLTFTGKDIFSLFECRK